MVSMVVVHGFSSTSTSKTKTEIAASSQSRTPTALFEEGDDESKIPEVWDENVDYDKEILGGSDDKGNV